MKEPNIMTTPEVRVAAVAALQAAMYDKRVLLSAGHETSGAFLDALLASPDRARALVAALSDPDECAYGCPWLRSAHDPDLGLGIGHEFMEWSALTEPDTRSEP